MRKRIEKEVLQVRKDFELARECHAEIYEYMLTRVKSLLWTIGRTF
jgi:hypothetical protein